MSSSSKSWIPWWSLSPPSDFFVTSAHRFRFHNGTFFLQKVVLLVVVVVIVVDVHDDDRKKRTTTHGNHHHAREDIAAWTPGRRRRRRFCVFCFGNNNVAFFSFKNSSFCANEKTESPNQRRDFNDDDVRFFRIRKREGWM